MIKVTSLKFCWKTDKHWNFLGVLCPTGWDSTSTLTYTSTFSICETSLLSLSLSPDRETFVNEVQYLPVVSHWNCSYYAGFDQLPSRVKVLYKKMRAKKIFCVHVWGKQGSEPYQRRGCTGQENNWLWLPIFSRSTPVQIWDPPLVVYDMTLSCSKLFAVLGTPQQDVNRTQNSAQETQICQHNITQDRKLWQFMIHSFHTVREGNTHGWVHKRCGKSIGPGHTGCATHYVPRSDAQWVRHAVRLWNVLNDAKTQGTGEFGGAVITWGLGRSNLFLRVGEAQALATSPWISPV